MKSVRKVMRARLVSRPKADAPRRGSAGRVTGDGTFLLPGEEAGQVSELQVSKRGRRGKGATPEPPQWVKVPVERLDDSGQAIDDEGDAELERALGAAAEGAQAPSMMGVRQRWEPWFAMRDACPHGREHRYGELQVRYHYSKQRRFLEEALGALG